MANKHLAKNSNQIVHQEAHYRGPIPLPAMLAEYETILPGSADRILSMAEKQSAHRIEIEKIAVKARARDSLLGIIAGFLIGSGVIILNNKFKSQLKQKNKKGFSIVEAIIVLSILSILSTTTWVTISNSKKIPLERKVWRNMERTIMACYIHYENLGDFPQSPVKENLLKTNFLSSLNEPYDYTLHMERTGDQIHIYVPRDQSFPDRSNPKRDWRGKIFYFTVNRLIVK